MLKALFLSFGLSLLYFSTLLASPQLEDNITQPNTPASLREQSLSVIVQHINTPTMWSKLNDPYYLQAVTSDVLPHLTLKELVELSEQMQKAQADEYATLKDLIQASWSVREFKIMSDETITGLLLKEYNTLSPEERIEVDFKAECERNKRENRERAMNFVLNFNLPCVSFSGVTLNEHEIWRITLKCNGLRSLDLSHSNISDKVLGLNCQTWSTNCTNLESLDISHTQVKFNYPIPLPLTCVLQLSACANWIDLGLRNNGIKNMVSAFPNLRRLDLSDSNYLHCDTDCLTMLQPLTGLTDLSIVNCQLTNSHLQHLNLLTTLVKLDFSNNMATLKTLTITLPNLQYVKWAEDWYKLKDTSDKKSDQKGVAG